MCEPEYYLQEKLKIFNPDVLYEYPISSDSTESKFYTIPLVSQEVIDSSMTDSMIKTETEGSVLQNKSEKIREDDKHAGMFGKIFKTVECFCEHTLISLAMRSNSERVCKYANNFEDLSDEDAELLTKINTQAENEDLKREACTANTKIKDAKRQRRVAEQALYSFDKSVQQSYATGYYNLDPENQAYIAETIVKYAVDDDIIKNTIDNIKYCNADVQSCIIESITRGIKANKRLAEEKNAYIRLCVETEMKNTAKVFDENEKEYWFSLIKDNSEQSNLSPALITAIIAKETKFDSQNSDNGAGPMQVTGITCKDMFPYASNERLKLYNMIDENMMNDILYKKNAAGEFLEDECGNKICKYSNHSALRNACSEDDDLGIKTGIMCFKMKFAEVVSHKRKISVKAAINGLKDGSIQLSEIEKKEFTTIALENYNSVFKGRYAIAVMDSIANIEKQNPIAKFAVI